MSLIIKDLHRSICRKLRRLSSRFVVLTVITFFWILYIISVQLEFRNNQGDEQYIREKIVKLSKEYVRIIRKDDKGNHFPVGVGGESRAELEGLKQTTIILLQNMLERLQILEKQVSTMASQSTQERFQLSQQIQNLTAAIQYKFSNIFSDVEQNDCAIPRDPLYPECATKVEWLKQYWKTDIKFSSNGVDGSICSFLVYLNKVESYCPSLYNKSTKLTMNDCEIPISSDYPDCKSKVTWMLQYWKTDKMYSNNGVDGSICSILVYLSKIESWCPLIPHASSAPAKNDCKIPNDQNYPHCNVKVDWMRSYWKSHKCYAVDYNVNGSVCSFLHYLSEVETWCPKKSNSPPVKKENRKQVDLRGTSKDDLINKLTNVVSASRLVWIRQRITRFYPRWIVARDNLLQRVNISHNEQKKILVHIGVLAEEKTLHFAETAGKGGPLGELVQWSDLITSLYALGHDIQVTVEHFAFVSSIGTAAGKRACPPKKKLEFDLIFTDYYGLNVFKKKAKNMVGLYSCRLRIIDSFGTEAQFNFNGRTPRYAAPPGAMMPKRNLLGANNLNLKQYMTMFPHSPDNSFLGFVVDSIMNVPKSVVKKPIALAYGKHYYMWKDLTSRGFLDVIHEHFEVHATTGGMELNKVKTYLPDYVINHGVLKPDQLQELLRKAKVFIGIGFPYEGPAPLEAIAQGCVFLNPKFIPPKNQLNTIFFKGKPTFRSLTSQHPYAETFIGEPYVYTVDIKNINAVKEAVKKIIDTNEPPPYLPFEYTHEGMLERVNAFVKHQDFCQSSSNWPPLSSKKVFVGKHGESCQDICLGKGLICEPAYFPHINNVQSLMKSTFPCDANKAAIRPSLVAPAYVRDDKQCVLQANRALYSCTGAHPSVQRICPCRDFRNGQVALCKTCY